MTSSEHIPDSAGQQEVLLPEEPLCAVDDTGIRYDFCHGLRMRFPSEGGPWRLTVSDVDTGTVLYDNDIAAGSVFLSLKKYYVRFRVQLAAGGWTWEHTLDLRGQTVAIISPAPTIGDTLAWIPYVEEFRKKHGCRIVVAVNAKFMPLFAPQYPEITFVDSSTAAMEAKPYACYFLGLWWKGDREHQPCDHRLVGLHHTIAYILGLDTEEEYRPLLDLSAPRRIAEPYVCIAVQSSTQSKNWTAPEGWIKVVQFLKGSGYRVLCCDRERVNGRGIVTNYIPWGCEDFTGDLPLQERINLIKDADFFVGLASGLSWMAWACGVPVVMISGFSHPLTEFYTPYRVINYNACNSCWNDPLFDFDHKDWLWCPRHKDTPRMHECMRMISAHQVIETIKQIPAFQRRTG